MNQNSIDRFARIVLGGVVVLLGSYLPMAEALLWALTILGILVMLSGLSGYCPIYHLLKIKTKK